MRIAILAYSFCSDNSIGSVRPAKWAEILSENNDVYVVTSDSCNINNIDYRIVSKDNILLKYIKNTRSFFNKQHKRYVYRVKSGVFSYRMPCAFDLWLPSALYMLYKIKPDIVIATHSPYISLISAYIYVVFSPNTKLHIDFRDLWVSSKIFVGVSFFRSLENQIEKRIVNRANLVTVVSHGLGEEIMKRYHDINLHVVYNSPVVGVNDVYSNLSPNVGCNGKCITISYTGTIYYDFYDIKLLFTWLSELRKKPGYIHGMIKLIVASANSSELLLNVQQYNLDDLVDIKGLVPRRESIEIQNASDVLLLFGFDKDHDYGIITGKLFEYLVTSNPILLIGSYPGSEVNNMISQYDRAITLDEIESILFSNKLDFRTYVPVDYSSVSKAQLIGSISTI